MTRTSVAAAWRTSPAMCDLHANALIASLPKSRNTLLMGTRASASDEHEFEPVPFPDTPREPIVNARVWFVTMSPYCDRI